jgi:hypothetical protein
MINYREETVIPVYFPFTFVSARDMAMLNRCFPKTVVLQPSELPVPPVMASWVAQQRLDIRVPVSGDGSLLQAAVSDFRRWARVHHGAMDAFRFHGESPFLYDDTYAASIRDQIRAASDPTPHGESDRFLFTARVFLQLAQEFDAQQLEVDGDLQAVSRMQQDMLNRVHGDGPTRDLPTDAFIQVPRDDGLFMADTRLKAWSRLWMAQPKADGPDACFVTCSPAVWQHVIEHIPQTGPTLQIPLPAQWAGEPGTWYRQVQRALDPMADAPAINMPKASGGLLTAVRVSGNAADVFGPGAGAARNASCGATPGGLVGLLTP